MDIATAETILDRADPATKAALHREIAIRYAWRDRNRRSRCNAPVLMKVRLRELERIFTSRYGRTLPDDDAGRDDLLIAAHTIAGLGGEVARNIVAWAAMWCPWMFTAEAEAIADRVVANPYRFKADTLAWRLRLTYAERTALNLTTIGAIDFNKAARLQRRKGRAATARRKARARMPRAVYLAGCASRSKPWEAFGISRRTWERRGKPVSQVSPVASVSPADKASTLSTHLRHHHQASKPKAVVERKTLPTSRPLPDWYGTASLTVVKMIPLPVEISFARAA
jgi:hypothetical protein